MIRLIYTALYNNAFILCSLMGDVVSKMLLFQQTHQIPIQFAFRNAEAPTDIPFKQDLYKIMFGLFCLLLFWNEKFKQQLE